MNPAEKKAQVNQEEDYTHTRETVLDSGIRIKKSYTPHDIAHLSYEKDIGDSGKFPYVRGIYPDMYWKKPWTRRLYAGFGNATETNRRFRFLLEHGQTGAEYGPGPAHSNGPRFRRPPGGRRRGAGWGWPLTP